MSTFIIVLRATQCLFTRMFQTYNIYITLLQAVICSLSSFFETKDRIVEYCIFTLPRSLEGLFDLLCKLGYARPIPFGLSFIFAASVTVGVMLRDRKQLSGNYHRMISLIFPEEPEEISEENGNEGENAAG